MTRRNWTIAIVLIGMGTLLAGCSRELEIEAPTQKEPTPSASKSESAPKLQPYGKALPPPQPR